MYCSTPLRNGDFRLKTTLSSDRFGPIEHLAGYPSPNLDFGHVPQVPLIHPNHPNQKVTVTLGALEARNVPLKPPLRHGDFRLKTTLTSDRFGPIEHLLLPP